MATIGLDCEVIVDGVGFFVKPGSYTLRQPRIRKTTLRADGGTSYIDLGPGRREWSLVVLCLNDLLQYDGTPTGTTGQQYRDSLRASYTNSVGTTVNFTDPLSGSVIAVHFDDYQEVIRDLHSQVVSVSTGGGPGASYEARIVLVEA